VNRKITGITVGALATLALSAAAFGGLRQDLPATLWPGTFLDVGYGYLGSARNSADSVQYIGCYTRGSNATCTVVNAAGQSGSCSTSNAAQLTAIHSMSSDAYLLFGWDNATGVCEFVYVRNFSYTPPKLP